MDVNSIGFGTFTQVPARVYCRMEIEAINEKEFISIKFERMWVCLDNLRLVPSFLSISLRAEGTPAITPM